MPDIIYVPSEELYQEQVQREAALRQAALGKRVLMAQEGHLTPVLRRWINADVIPIADNLRRVAHLYLSGDMEGVALALGTPTAALSQRERPLRPIMEWVLRGSSPGRAELSDTTYAEDLSLAFMGTLIPRLARGTTTLSASLSLAADTLRETVQGQFITSVQGAEAMQRVRENNPEKWQQRRSLQRIAMQMKAQVKPQFLADQVRIAGGEESTIQTRGNRRVISVTDFKGDLRRLEFLREPDTVDWEIMSLCWHDTSKTSASHPYQSVWLSFATMLLSLAQQSGGWFEVVDRFKVSTSGPRRKHKTKMLQLSEKSFEAISRDVERWVGCGFIAEPMLIPPEQGDYLTVKHRKVTGQRPPLGLITNPTGTSAWAAASLVAASPWQINEFSPAFETEEFKLEEDPWLAMKVGSHRKLGSSTFYLPVNMDFRGRVYYRTPWVTPQSDDLGKSMLRFPPNGTDRIPTHSETRAVARHLDNCDPLTRAAHEALIHAHLWDTIPLQLDGSCNGLQHLSALMRDEAGAAQVNLTKGGDVAADVYGAVASTVADQWQGIYAGDDEATWLLRFEAAGVSFDRALCKGPVMVLPYGGTREAVRLAVKDAVLKQLKVAPGEETVTPWHLVEEDGYAAFSQRALEDHPLFNEDIRHLASLVYACISPAIPKAMAAMDTLQHIGKWIGTSALAWYVGEDKENPGERPMWVYQAKAKSSRKRVTMKGYHLPDVIRRLTLVAQTNEVDPRAHKSGIVANFIHSLDAEHLTRTVHRFKKYGGSCVGTIHDCVMCRPSEASIMHKALRETFKEMYEEDPLSRPVKVIPTEGVDAGVGTYYESWYALAEAAGTAFPEKGTWQPSQVLDSQWFFS